MKGILKKTKQGWRVIFQNKALKLMPPNEQIAVNATQEQINEWNGKKVNFAVIVMEDTDKKQTNYAVLGPNMNLSDADFKQMEKLMSQYG